MKIKKATITGEKKLPIYDESGNRVDFSNRSASVSLELEFDKEVGIEDLEKELSPVWEELKYEVDKGLSEDRQEWLLEKKEEFQKKIAANKAIQRNMERMVNK